MIMHTAEQEVTRHIHTPKRVGLSAGAPNRSVEPRKADGNAHTPLQNAVEETVARVVILVSVAGEVQRPIQRLAYCLKHTTDWQLSNNRTNGINAVPDSQVSFE